LSSWLVFESISGATFERLFRLIGTSQYGCPTSSVPAFGNIYMKNASLPNQPSLDEDCMATRVPCSKSALFTHSNSFRPNIAWRCLRTWAMRKCGIYLSNSTCALFGSFLCSAKGFFGFTPINRMYSKCRMNVEVWGVSIQECLSTFTAET